MKHALIYTEIETEWANLVSQDCWVFNDLREARKMLKKVFDNIQDELNYLTIAEYGNDSAKIYDARGHRTHYFTIITSE